MKIEDVARIDWKQDKELLALERKMGALIERDEHRRARLGELQQIVRDAEETLVHCRAAMLLNEPSDEPEEVIQQRLSASRLEISEIQGDLEALKLARTRFEPAVAAAAAEARLRVAAMLLGPYRETVETLKALLMKAAEQNKVLHAIHRLTVKQNLAGEIHGNRVLKPLTMLAAWNFLTVPNGMDGGEFQYWKQYVDKIFHEN